SKNSTKLTDLYLSLTFLSDSPLFPNPSRTQHNTHSSHHSSPSSSPLVDNVITFGLFVSPVF
ncbi:unnamed protein product, partial [Prunus brigantina]